MTFDGIVITVSHDRYFLDRVTRRIFAFEENGQIKQYEGGYTDYRGKISESEQTTPEKQAQVAGTSKKDWKSPSTKLKFSYKEQREYEVIEDEIAALEEKIEMLESQILKSATDFVKLNEYTIEKEKTQQMLEEKMDRWMYLEDLKAKIDAQ